MTKVNNTLAHATIEKQCESDRQRLFRDILTETCAKLLQRIDEVSSAAKDAEEEKEHVQQQLQALKHNIQQDMRDKFDQTELPHVEVKPFRITHTAGSYDTTTGWWFTKKTHNHYFGLFAGTERIVTEMLNHTYNSSFAETLITHGNRSLTDSCRQLATKLEERAGELSDLVAVLSQKQTADDSVSLKAAVTRLDGAIQRGDTLRQMLANVIACQAADHELPQHGNPQERKG